MQAIGEIDGLRKRRMQLRGGGVAERRDHGDLAQVQIREASWRGKKRGATEAGDFFFLSPSGVV
jgi:hypothetical protein